MTPDTYRYCRYQVDDPLLTLTIDRPEVLNAMHPDAHHEFADAFDRYVADPSLRVAIVTGAGKQAFCAGTDPKALDATGEHKAIDRICRHHAPFRPVEAPDRSGEWSVC